jgi:imidazolonepropionase-like amidohydrolase
MGCRATFRRIACVPLLLVAVTIHAADLAVTGVQLHPAPHEPVIDNATVIIRGGRIAAVGAGLDPGGLPRLDGAGRVATAGLWNCHVHLTDPELAHDPAGVLAEMLLRYGFTSVVDTGSDLAATRRLADAIESGLLDGPHIVTAAGSFVYTDGTPSYLPGIRLPELATPQAAAPAVGAVLDAGGDGIKIFSGSFISSAETVLMPLAVIRAVVAAAQARGRFVVAHPTDRNGLVNAVAGGVDALAHTAPPAGPLGTALVAEMLERRVALIPTLMLWSWELRRFGVPEADVARYQQAGVNQLAEYAAAGGEVLFGTDVGYVRDYDTREEIEMMARAGMTFPGVLAALTTAPARRFTGETGRVEPGAPGDLVLYAGDPASDVTALSRVAVTVRGGRIVYRLAE